MMNLNVSNFGCSCLNLSCGSGLSGWGMCVKLASVPQIWSSYNPQGLRRDSTGEDRARNGDGLSQTGSGKTQAPGSQAA